MRHSRIARTIFAVLFFAAFCVYIYLTYPQRITSADIADWGPAGGLKPEGYGDAVAIESLTVPEEAIPVEAIPEAAPEAEPEPAAVSLEPAAEPEMSEAAKKAAELGLPAPPDIDINEWQFVLVNADNPLDPQDYAPPEIVNVSSSNCPVDSRIAEPLMAFADATAAQGLQVYLSSGYRSYNEQSQLFTRKVTEVGSEDAAARIVTRPGTSEHQTGLCCDITDYYRNPKAWQDLEPTATFQWMVQHCQEYGFILRYPKDKSGLDTNAAAESVTGIIYEPWHFRYVGVEAAAYIMENGLCLEEFVALYR